MSDVTAARLTCGTCPHACSLASGQVGYCRARVSDGEAIVPQSYGRITSLALDPIEKKPIARWNPGTTVLSLGSYGCTMRCPFCQNDSIAQVGADGVQWFSATPQGIVQRALDLRYRGCIGIAYTYNEPLAGWEFVRDTAQLAHDAGLKNVLVSNGMVNAEPLAEVATLIDAANIDLKCFTEEGYRTLGGDLTAVKRTIETLVRSGTCHVEVTTLVVPGLNDTAKEIDALCTWLADIDPDIPYHLSRFFPHFKMMDARSTPISSMHELASVARTHMHDVLFGNM
ncbi:MAG: AmmeMemoRadiSam system radical SAM enzyme [Eggerthellaceae bacterium]|nr:AmmeMemoRadiSam system radical SAM enzyme [Eggerthellaceae bacterium]